MDQAVDSCCCIRLPRPMKGPLAIFQVSELAGSGDYCTMNELIRATTGIEHRVDNICFESACSSVRKDGKAMLARDLLRPYIWEGPYDIGRLNIIN